MELIAHNLCKRYGDHPALEGVNLRAGAGVVAILGPNGAGKSTLMRMLATVLKPDAGEISFGGRPYAPDPRPIRRLLGYLPQETGLPGHMTPRRLLRYLAQLKGLTADEQIGGVLADVGLGQESDRPLGTLSGGQVRRVGIAQALLGSPPLLVLDEPTAGLDLEERNRVMRLIHGRGDGRVVVLSTHIPGDLEAVANQVVVLRGGTIRFAGTVETMRQLAAGYVHEVSVPKTDVEHYMSQAIVSRVASNQATASLRVVGPIPAGVAFQPVPPSIEDAYLLLQR